MSKKTIHIFNSRDYWFYKILDVCFCITYHNQDIEENEDVLGKTPDPSEKPISVPNTAIIERDTEKEIMIHGPPGEIL